MKLTFAYWGNYTIIFENLFRRLKINFISPEKTNSAVIREGVKISPEMYCFPLKVNIGNYLSALKRGADTILMWENIGGSCRQRYYGLVQEKVLRDNGFKVEFLIFNIRSFWSQIKNLSSDKNISFWQTVQAFRFALQELKFVEKLERKAHCLRPREKKSGTVDQILNFAFESLGQIKNRKDFLRLKKDVLKRISKIEVEKKKNPPQVGLVGEIYTVTDATVNFDLEKKLGAAGVEVHREMNLTYHLKKAIFPWKDWQIQRKINPYLGSTVGGHGRDAIYEMLDYVKKDFDGIIQLLPWGCMPETTVRPILEKIHQESGIPFLSLSLDEQVAEAGIDTRLEAFTDVVRNYHKNKKL